MAFTASISASQGSTINLTCIIKYSPDAPSHTFWHFRDKVINQVNLIPLASNEPPLQVLSFETEPRLSQFTENGETFTNYLLIRDVNVNDSGKYACAPSNAEPASILVHVVNGKSRQFMTKPQLISYQPTGENPEAYSSSSQLSSCRSPYKILCLTLSLHLFLCSLILSRQLHYLHQKLTLASANR